MAASVTTSSLSIICCWTFWLCALWLPWHVCHSHGQGLLALGSGYGHSSQVLSWALPSLSSAPKQQL